MKLKNAFSTPKRQTPKGNAGYNNSTENIDPHIRTKAVSTKEITLSDGASEGYVKNDGNGVLTGGHAGSAGGGSEVTSTNVLTDETLVQGDGGSRGVKTSTATVSQVATCVSHAADNSQAHSDYLVNNAADVGVGLTLTGDNSTADTAYVPMVLYNTDATPPTASGFPVGTIYVQYTA